MSGKKRNFLVHGGILAFTGIIVRIIGMFYRIPLLNIIGSEGNGIYSVAYNIYNIMLVLSSYGLPMAVSKLVSARYSQKQYKNMSKVFKCSLVVSVCSGGTAALLLYFGADLIEKMYKSVDGLAIPLRVLAPTIFFVAVMGVFRGFFQGQGTMIPTAFSQLFEQIVNAVVSIVASYMLVRAFSSSENVAAYGAAGGTMGTALGALAALLILMGIYFVNRPSLKKSISGDVESKRCDNGAVYKTIILTMLPIILGQTLYQISAVIDDAVFSNIMAKRLDSSVIKSDLGNFSSSYSLLIGIPQGVASAMSASMLPSVVASFTEKKYNAVRAKIGSTIKTNMFIAVPSFVGLFILGTPIIKLLFSSYDSVQGGMMLKLGAMAVVFYTLSTVTSSALQGIDKMGVPVKHSLISLMVHIVAVFALLKFTDMGIYAVVLGNATFPILIFVLNLISLRKYVDFRLEYFKTFLVPFVSSVFMGVISLVTYNALINVTASNTISLVAALFAALIAYFGPMLLFKKFNLY